MHIYNWVGRDVVLPRDLKDLFTRHTGLLKKRISKNYISDCFGFQSFSPCGCTEMRSYLKKQRLILIKCLELGVGESWWCTFFE